MKIIGISGYIASGKTSFCQYGLSWGAYYYPTDRWAHYIMSHQQSIKKKIIYHFGKESYLPNGTLNRSYLSCVFDNPEQIKKINELVHPPLRQHTIKHIACAKKHNYPIFLYESALIQPETKSEFIHDMVLIYVKRDEALKRACLYKKMPKQQALKRLNFQPDYENDIDNPHYYNIIVNNTDIKTFFEHACRLFNTWTGRNQPIHS